MSSIPSTFNPLRRSYTVLESEKMALHDPSLLPISVVLLNRGERLYKEDQFKGLQKIGFSQIISVEPPDAFYDVEEYAKRFRNLKFVIPKEKISIGECINIATEEADQPLVLVLWNNVALKSESSFKRVFKAMAQKQDSFFVPFCYNKKQLPVPTLFEPALYKANRLKVILTLPTGNRVKTLLPYDYTMFFQKRLFQQVGGFDPRLRTPYWQLLDFGMRSYLWGYQLITEMNFCIEYLHDLVPLDQSHNEDYPLFYLKNLAIKIRKGYYYLPYYCIFRYHRQLRHLHSSKMVPFKQIKRWVSENRSRFCKDSVAVVQSWEMKINE